MPRRASAGAAGAIEACERTTVFEAASAAATAFTMASTHAAVSPGQSLRFLEWIDHPQPVEGLPVLHVFRVQRVRVAFDGRLHDEGVPE